MLRSAATRCGSLAGRPLLHTGCRQPISAAALPRRRWLSTEDAPAAAAGGSEEELLRVCVVGAGPAGFYTAQNLLKAPDAVGGARVRVDILERLPTPFGLVRYGVAPDHPDVKNVTNTFEAVLADERVRFAGNVEVGKDVQISDLKKHYSVVVVATGADADKKLFLPGEDLEGVFSARDLVNWYNGFPHVESGADGPGRSLSDGLLAAQERLVPDLSCEGVVIVGQGNVAVDVARMLLAPVDRLRGTDICEEALQLLSESRVRRVHMVGRRGPLDAALSIKELRELIRLPAVQSHVHFDETPELLQAKEKLKDKRARARLSDLLFDLAREERSGATVAEHPGERHLHLDFFLTPSEITERAESGHVGGVVFERSALTGPPGRKWYAPSGEMVEMECGMVVRSIGYRSYPLKGVPFDPKRGIVPSADGAVTVRACDDFSQLGPYRSLDDAITDPLPTVSGLYCAGWIKRGPIGVIAGTIADARETADRILMDVAQGRVPPPGPGRLGWEGIRPLLEAKEQPTVSREGWQRIREHEVRTGEAKGKVALKVPTCKEMLRIAQA